MNRHPFEFLFAQIFVGLAFGLFGLQDPVAAPYEDIPLIERAFDEARAPLPSRFDGLYAGRCLGVGKIPSVALLSIVTAAQRLEVELLDLYRYWHGIDLSQLSRKEYTELAGTDSERVPVKAFVMGESLRWQTGSFKYELRRSKDGRSYVRRSSAQELIYRYCYFWQRLNLR